SHQFFPGWQIDGVEIDPEIVSLGRRYFALTDDDARVFVEDGRVFISRTDKKYRLIFLDAYHDVTCPFHMATREFFQQLGKNLDEDGIIALNINLRSGFTPDLFTYISSTMAGVFPAVTVCSHPDYYNRIIFASKRPDFLNVFKQNAEALPTGHPLKNLATASIPHFSSVKSTEFILTDDLAPVEMIGFKMMNEQIRAAFREILIRVILKVAVA
ncbi:MAG: fused MFS/spermidine synthase, partial [Candidatus Riflebacteria bacterium]